MDGCMELNNKDTRCLNDFKITETPVIKPDYIMTSLPVSAPSVFCIAPLSHPHRVFRVVSIGCQISTAGPNRVYQGQLHMNVARQNFH